MDVIKHRPLGILGPVLYDFVIQDNLDPGTFASDHAFVWADAEKRAETSATYSPRFFAAANMTLLFYWTTSDTTSAPKGVFALNRDSTVEYMKDYEGKPHMLVIRTHPSQPRHRVVYLSLSSEAQAKQLAQKIVECRPEVLAITAKMAKLSETDARHELEGAESVRDSRNELLSAFRASIDRARAATSLLEEVELRLSAASRAHRLFAIDDTTGTSDTTGSQRRWVTADSASSAGHPPIPRSAGSPIAASVSRSASASSSPIAASRTPTPSSASGRVAAVHAVDSAQSVVRRSVSDGAARIAAAVAASASATASGSPPRGWSRVGSSDQRDMRGPARPRSSASMGPEEAAEEALRLLVGMEERLRAAAGDATRLESIAITAERRFKQLAHVNGMLVRQFRRFVREWGPAGAARQFGRASALTKEQRKRRRAIKSDSRSQAGSVTSRSNSTSVVIGAGASLTVEDIAAIGLNETDDAESMTDTTEPPPLGPLPRLLPGTVRQRSGSAGRARMASNSPRLALHASGIRAAGESLSGGVDEGESLPSPLGRARSNSVGAVPVAETHSSSAAVAGAGAGIGGAVAAPIRTGDEGGGSLAGGSGGSSIAFNRLMLDADGTVAPAALPKRRDSAASSSQLSEAEVQDMLKHLPPPPSATDDDPFHAGFKGPTAGTATRRPSNASEQRRSIFGGLFGRRGTGDPPVRPGGSASKAAAASSAASKPVGAVRPPNIPSAVSASSDKRQPIAVAGNAALTAESSDGDITTSMAQRFPGRVIALIMQVQNLPPTAIQPSSWAFVAVDAFGKQLRSPPIQAFLDPETKRSCALSVRGAKGGFVALSFNVDRPLTDSSANLKLRVVGQKTFRADLELGSCAIATWQLQQWPGKAHAVWAELHPVGTSPPAPKPYEIPVPVGRDLRHPDRAVLAELPPPPVTGKPCVLLQLVYAVMRPGDGGKLPRVRFFDSARARREMDAARAQVERMQLEAGRRGNAAEEVVFSDDDPDEEHDIGAAISTTATTAADMPAFKKADTADDAASGPVKAAPSATVSPPVLPSAISSDERLETAQKAAEAEKSALTSRCNELEERVAAADARAVAAETGMQHTRKQLQALARAYKKLQAKFDAAQAKADE